jgi:hypothetical protein
MNDECRGTRYVRSIKQECLSKIILFGQALWKIAAELARAHGVFRTAQVLRLDYSKLIKAGQSLWARNGRLQRADVRGVAVGTPIRLP